MSETNDGDHVEAEIIPPAEEEVPDEDELTESIEEPAKVIRIGAMIRKLLEEVREADLDEKSRARMKEIYETSVKELSEGLSPDLREELDRLATPFDDDGELPSEAELRIAQAQLVGWLEGLFHGIQATLVAQQVAAQSQLQQMAGRGLPMPRQGDDPTTNTGYL
jgi:hypothetical protein